MGKSATGMFRGVDTGTHKLCPHLGQTAQLKFLVLGEVPPVEDSTWRASEKSLSGVPSLISPCLICWRKNPVHFQESSHPGDADYKEEEPEDVERPECPYGTDCYRSELWWPLRHALVVPSRHTWLHTYFIVNPDLNWVFSPQTGRILFTGRNTNTQRNQVSSFFCMEANLLLPTTHCKNWP